eukprot:7163596-Alexandrium_andersonii.AAC.1
MAPLEVLDAEVHQPVDLQVRDARRGRHALSSGRSRKRSRTQSPFEHAHATTEDGEEQHADANVLHVGDDAGEALHREGDAVSRK